MVVGKDLLNPENLPNDLALFFNLLGECLRLVKAVIAHDPVQVLRPVIATVHLALLFPVPLNAAITLLPLGNAIAPEASRQQHGEQLLYYLIPPAPELLGVIRGRDEDCVLHHLEYIRIGTAEELSPVIERPGRARHGGERWLQRSKGEVIGNETRLCLIGSRGRIFDASTDL